MKVLFTALLIVPLFAFSKQNIDFNLSVDSQTNSIYTQSANCNPFTESSFVNLLDLIKSQDVEDSKFKKAKIAFRYNCATANQVLEILELFDVEKTKLEFAKFAFEKTTDQNNYHLINSSFNKESSVQGLKEYIEMRY